VVNPQRTVVLHRHYDPVTGPTLVTRTVRHDAQ
jgi:hypothetical protein